MLGLHCSTACKADALTTTNVSLVYTTQLGLNLTHTLTTQPIMVTLKLFSTKYCGNNALRDTMYFGETSVRSAVNRGNLRDLETLAIL